MNQILDKPSKPRAIAKIGIAFIISWALLAAFIFSNAGISFKYFQVALGFSVIWLTVWLFRLVLLLPYFRRYKSFQRSSPSSVVFWSIEPIAFLFVTVLAYSDTPLLARLYISSPALERYVKEVQEGKVAMSFEYEFGHPSRSVGLYSIFLTETIPNNGVQFLTSSDGLFGRAGFAYCPNGEPPHRGESSYVHIYGPWWKWKEWL